MDRFSTYYFGIKLSILIFSIIEQVSITLQGKEVNVQDGFHAAEITLKYIERLRMDKKFSSFFSNEVKNEASEKCDPPVLPRQRQIPRRIDDGYIAQHVFTSVEDHYRKEYFEAIDALHGDFNLLHSVHQWHIFLH